MQLKNIYAGALMAVMGASSKYISASLGFSYTIINKIKHLFPSKIKSQRAWILSDDLSHNFVWYFGT